MNSPCDLAPGGGPKADMLVEEHVAPMAPMCEPINCDDEVAIVEKKTSIEGK